MMAFPVLRPAAIAALVLLTLAGISRTTPSAVAQNAERTTVEQALAAVQEGGAPAASAISPDVGPPTTLQPAPPPRTLRAYWHVFIAFAVTWLLLFGYAVALGRRWARLEREVQVLSVE